MQQYSFPILTQKEILSYVLAETGIVLEEAQLIKPYTEVVLPVYETLALLILGQTRDELQQPEFHALEKLEDPELHEESIGIFASIRAIMKVMTITDVPDFSTMDIFKPVSERTRTNLSAIINLLKFRQGCERDLRDTLVERERICSLYQQSEERLASLITEIETIEADRLAQQSAVQILEAETKELNQEVQALNKQHGALNSDIRALKQAGQGVQEEISAEKFSIIQLKDDQTRLKSQIVLSPQKLQKSLAEKKATLISSKASAEEAQQLLNSSKDKLEAYKKVEKKLMKFIGMLDEVEKLWIKQKATVKEKKTLKAQIKTIEEELESLDRELSQLKFQEQHWLDLTEKVEQQGPKILQEAKRELNETKANCLPLLARIDERGAATLKAEEQVREIREKMEAMHRKQNDTVARGEAAIQKVMKETLHHFRTLLELGPSELASVPSVK